MAVTQRIAAAVTLAATCAAALAGCGIGEPTTTTGSPGAKKSTEREGRQGGPEEGGAPAPPRTSAPRRPVGSPDGPPPP